jgi:protein involved in polysaccharide export with SLBB domain
MPATMVWCATSTCEVAVRMWRWLVASVVSLALAGAAAAQAPQAAEPGGSEAASISAGQAYSTQASNQYDYKLGAGDKVRIIVFGEESLTGEFDVPGGKGTISFPLVGDIQAGGLTVGQLETEVEGKLRDGYLKDPHVSIEVLNYRPFYILGEVTKPGEYPYTNGLTVLNAVATANGFTYRADTRHVFIKRANEPVEQELPLTSMTLVAPGDTIRIKERFF